MTLYIASGDITDVITITTGTNTVDTATTAARDTNYCNCSMQFSATREGYIGLGATQADVWFHVTMYFSTFSTLSASYDILRFSNGALSEFRLRLTPSSSSTSLTSVALEKTTNGSTWTTVGSAFFLTSAVRYTLDIRLKPDASTGIATVILNGAQVFSFSGDTSTQTNLMDRAVLTGNTSAGAPFFSEFAATDGATPTINWRVQSILPNGAGTYSEFTGASTAIDEIQIDTSDFIISNTVGQRFAANYVDATTTQLGSMEIKGLVSVSNAGLSTDSTPADLQHFLRSNSSDFTSSNLGHSRDGVNRVRFTVYETNPATSAKFTLVEAAAIQLGVKAV